MCVLVKSVCFVTVLSFRGCFTRSSGLCFSWYCYYSNDFPLPAEADLNGRKLWNMGLLHFDFIKTCMNVAFMIGCVVSVYLLPICFYVMDLHKTLRFMLWSSGLRHRAIMWHVGTGVSDERTASTSRVKIYQTKGIKTQTTAIWMLSPCKPKTSCYGTAW